MKDRLFHLAQADGAIVCGATTMRIWAYGSQWEFSDTGSVVLQSASLLGRGAHACAECVRIAEIRGVGRSAVHLESRGAISSAGRAFTLEDGFHMEAIRQFEDLESAVTELRRLEQLTSAGLATEIGQTPCRDNCGHRELHVIDDHGREVAAGSRPRNKVEAACCPPRSLLLSV